MSLDLLPLSIDLCGRHHQASLDALNLGGSLKVLELGEGRCQVRRWSGEHIVSIKLGNEVSLQITVETTARKIMFILLSVTLRRVVVGRKSRSLASWWRIPPLSAVFVALLPGTHCSEVSPSTV